MSSALTALKRQLLVSKHCPTSRENTAHRLGYNAPRRRPTRLCTREGKLRAQKERPPCGGLSKVVSRLHAVLAALTTLPWISERPVRRCGSRPAHAVAG